FPYSLEITIPVMGIGHALLGIIEGVITAGVVGYLLLRRPDLLERKEVGKTSLALVAILIALSPIFAYLSEAVNYSEPMENAARILGLEDNLVYHGLFPDYTVPETDPYIGSLISGVVGVLIVFAISYIIRYARSSRKES
ncbi:MAG: energy-coupling factor ABC transporter permease, partial [Archaeoglobaceae archaeon]|nr:energy-coupling factor ABC transporter permease [Archaeoglobaceae archaeon]